MSRSWDRSDDARAINSPVDVDVVEVELHALDVGEDAVADVRLGSVRELEPEVAANRRYRPPGSRRRRASPGGAGMGVTADESPSSTAASTIAPTIRTASMTTARPSRPAHRGWKSPRSTCSCTRTRHRKANHPTFRSAQSWHGLATLMPSEATAGWRRRVHARSPNMRPSGSRPRHDARRSRTTRAHSQSIRTRRPPSRLRCCGRSIVPLHDAYARDHRGRSAAEISHALRTAVGGAEVVDGPQQEEEPPDRDDQPMINGRGQNDRPEASIVWRKHRPMQP